MRFQRIVCIVLDGVGVGEAPDAAEFGDVGSDSLGNTARVVGSLRLPMLGRMGLGHILPLEGVPADPSPVAFHGKMAPRSLGKDSTSGHWELMGCIVDRPFPVYPSGFPDDLVGEFERRIGRKIIGNKAASGTTIIQELGEEHLRSGRPILYTSQDSVFQVAAHEAVIPRDELYRCCEIARSILAGPHAVARVIARPFSGDTGGFFRTEGRRDYSLAPTGRTVLDGLVDTGRAVLAIGKIHDLFAGRGITRRISTKDNREGMQATLDAVSEARWSVVFTNLIDFDMMWGHRNDARAYALGLEEFDSYLPGLIDKVGADVLLIITSDHGNDPTTPSTGHSREHVPLLVYHKRSVAGPGRRCLGIRSTLADVGRTVADNFDLAEEFPGTSFLPNVVL
jgi:phosphopentomutase